MRLEVHETNHAAISLYRKSGYREFGRHHEYYEDGGHALRFEKRLYPGAASLAERAALFPPDHRFYLRGSLLHDGARLGGPRV